jgi:hypothetical protein
MNFKIEYNTSLKVFSQLYVGVRTTNNNDVPLAFATPYETTAAGVKRQETVKNWTRDYGREKNPDLRVVENEPRSGFRITDDVKRTYWGGGNVVWRLHDPLGWEIEIQSNNLMALLQSVGVGPNGEVPGKCVIARDGAHNVLLPVSTDEYKNAIKAAEGAKAPGKVPMKDRVIGRFYRLQDGSYGQYLGKMFVRRGERDYGHHQAHKSKINFDINGQQYIADASVSNLYLLNKEKMDQYEIVYVPPEGDKESYLYRTGGSSRLYKSAPLIAELDQGSISKDEAERRANNSSMNYAGSTSGSAEYASFDPDYRIQYGTAPILKEDLLSAKGRAIKRAEQELKSFLDRGLGAHKTWSCSIMLMLQNYPTSIYFHDDVSSVYGNVQSFHADSGRADLAGPILFHEDRLQAVAVQGYSRPSLRHPHEQNIWHKALVLPMYNTIEELEAAIDEYIGQDQFVQLKARKVK